MKSHTTATNLFFLATLLFVSPYTNGMTTEKSLSREQVSLEGNNKIHFEGLLGTFHSKLTNAVKVLKIAQNNFDKAKSVMLPGSNTILLHGPCGNGKSTLPRKIAEAADASFFELPGPSMLDPYVGGGEKNIREVFAKVWEKIATGQVVVLFIDEADAIAAKAIRKDENKEYLSMRQALWLELDKIKKDPRILLIAATNHFQDFDEPLRDRFYPIEIKNPDENLRLQILEHYWNEYLSSYPCNKPILKKIAGQSEGLSIRALEQLIASLASTALACDLLTIKEQLIWEEFKATKTKTLGTYMNWLKEKAANTSTGLQTHVYPHLSALGTISTTIVAYFQLKGAFSQQSVQNNTTKTSNVDSQDASLPQMSIDSGLAGAAA